MFLVARAIELFPEPQGNNPPALSQWLPYEPLNNVIKSEMVIQLIGGGSNGFVQVVDLVILVLSGHLHPGAPLLPRCDSQTPIPSADVGTMR